MIAKFETNSGWSFMECADLDTRNERIDPATAQEEHSVTFGVDENVKDCKRVVLTRYDGGLCAVYYNKEAYLMNNQGDTICAL